MIGAVSGRDGHDRVPRRTGRWRRVASNQLSAARCTAELPSNQSSATSRTITAWAATTSTVAMATESTPMLSAAGYNRRRMLGGQGRRGIAFAYLARFLLGVICTPCSLDAARLNRQGGMRPSIPDGSYLMLVALILV